MSLTGLERLRIIPAYAGSTALDFQAGLTWRDHPRIRGEHWPPPAGRSGCGGSSPHTRGARLRRRQSSDRSGIIPAYAGSTGSSPPAAARRSDHPRIRGEHQSAMMTYLTLSGSSPHTRGAQLCAVIVGTSNGIIPAYAGSTATTPHAVRKDMDHPRIRGEHLSGDRFRDDRHGSSPHTRGARGSRRGRSSRCRIIPAYAGSTRVRNGGLMAAEDHPRIRGEHDPCPLALCATVGSSPHTRGALLQILEKILSEGIIPAYAGSTRPWRDLRRRRSDHPRIRGEHRLDIPWPQAMQGSSPHTRGARPRRPTQYERTWIIPAYAGSTPPRCERTRRKSDHPRIRGEHSFE